MKHLRKLSLGSIKNIYRTTRSSSTKPPTIEIPKPSQSQSPLRRYRRAILWTSVGLAVGATTGTLISQTIAPPPHPLPGSPLDLLLLSDLNSRIDSEFKVKVLRGKCTAVAASLRGSEATWRELDSNNTPGGVYIDSTLSGARSLGVQRIFWNEKARELVAVVWFGGGMSGWPGVTHGGGIATVVSEKMALAARLAVGSLPPLPSPSSSSSSSSSLSSNQEFVNSEPKSLDLTYKKPTYANAFYVIRAVPKPETTSSKDEQVEVDAQVETLDGKICVTVTGVVPVHHHARDARQSAVESTSLKSLTPAKSWLGWQSRSDM